MAFHPVERSDICAVVITYHPPHGCADLLSELAAQTDRVLIVDNGSPPESLDALSDATLRIGAVVMRLGENLGIARALNVALDYAHQHNYRWLATFDQDSRMTQTMIADMCRTLTRYPDPAAVGLITPTHVDRKLGFTVKNRGHEASGTEWRIVASTMTSGNLVKVEAATGVGGFDDSLFIDYVDHDFCLRLRDGGYRVLEATQAVLLHSLGNLQRRRFGFLRVSVTNHPALRRYYMSRNRLILWRRHWRRYPGWVARDVRRFCSETLWMVLYEGHVPDKLQMIWRGIRHGWRGIRGPYKSDPA
jgi:rhamnosyltransferase